MQIVICDDLSEERKLIKEYMRRLEKDDNLEFDITEFESAEELVSAFDNGLKPDVIFLDIYMKEMNGMTAAKLLSEKGYDNSIVFCTTSLDHAVESYKIKADGYLVKPYTYEAFLSAIWRCRQRFEKSKKCLSFVSERISYNVPLKDVFFVETESRGCNVVSKNEKLFTYKKIGEFECDLSSEPSFLKVGRCYVVNMNNIQRIESDALLFQGGFSVPLPSRDKKRIMQTVNDWFWKKARGD